MPAAGWFDDGTGRQRWWDGERWTDRYQDAEPPVDGSAVAPLKVFRGSGGGSASLTVYPNFVEYEHTNYFVTIPVAKLGPLSYSKKAAAPYNAVALTPDVDFYSDDPRAVYEYLRSYLAGR